MHLATSAIFRTSHDQYDVCMLEWQCYDRLYLRVGSLDVCMLLSCPHAAGADDYVTLGQLGPLTHPCLQTANATFACAQQMPLSAQAVAMHKVCL